jgi:hypothetical protein
MKTFAHYDSTGAIRALIAVDAPEGISAGLEPEAGTFVDEVEGVEINLEEPDIDAIRETAQNYKVEPPRSGPRRLVKK